MSVADDSPTLPDIPVLPGLTMMLKTPAPRSR